MFAAGFVAIWLYLAWGFALGPIDIPTTTFSRSRWFYALGNTENGWTGIVICGALACLCGWWLALAVWRLATNRPALVVDGHTLRFHPSYRVKTIPLDEVSTVGIREVAPARLFGMTQPIHALEFLLKSDNRFGAGRKVRIMSNTVQDGLQALREVEHACVIQRPSPTPAQNRHPSKADRPG
jgi:hypothetical protein